MSKMEIQKLLGVLLDFKKMFPKGKTMLIERVAINIDSLIDELYQTTNQSDFEMVQTKYDEKIKEAELKYDEAVARKLTNLVTRFAGVIEKSKESKALNEDYLEATKALQKVEIERLSKLAQGVVKDGS